MRHTISGEHLARVLAFSDSVVAVAITVLVLPLVSIAAPESGRPFTAVITDNWRMIFAFLLTFAIVYILWQGHHRVFENFAAIDDTIVWLNGLWLATIALLPWPSRMLDVDGSGRLTAWLYCATLFLNAILLHTIYLRGRRHPDLLRNPAIWPQRSLSFQFAALFAILTAVALVQPRVAVWALWVVVPMRFVVQEEGRLRAMLWPSPPSRESDP